MTNCIIALSLIITPSPVTARQETPLWATSPSVAFSAAYQPATSPFSIETFTSAETPLTTDIAFVETESVATNGALPLPVPDIPPPAPPPELTLRERALNRLSELGAPQWVVNGFDCIGFRESHWTNLRSKTGDSGVLQINDIHNPELGWLELDPWIPEQAAEYSWLLFTRRGWSFRDWVTAAGCGLR